MLRPRGTLVLKSTYAQQAQVNLTPVVIQELTVLGSRCGPFPDAIAVPGPWRDRRRLHDHPATAARPRRRGVRNGGRSAFHQDPPQDRAIIHASGNPRRSDSAALSPSGPRGRPGARYDDQAQNYAPHRGHNREGAIDARRRVCEILGAEYDRLTSPEQVHGGEVVAVEEGDIGRGRDGRGTAVRYVDGLLCDKPGVPLILLSADCPLVCVYDPKRRAVGPSTPVGRAPWPTRASTSSLR